MFDGTDRAGRQPQANDFAKRVGQQRRDLQVRQETAAGLIVGMADIVAGHYAFTRHGASSGHGLVPENLV